jgi:hypothetical protein
MNTQFHLAIGAIARMPVLQDMLQRAFDRWMRVRHFYFSGVLVRRTAQAQAEHREILSMMRQRDYGGLEEVIRRHNRDALTAYAAHHRAAAAEVRDERPLPAVARSRRPTPSPGTWRRRSTSHSTRCWTRRRPRPWARHSRWAIARWPTGSRFSPWRAGMARRAVSHRT